MISRRTLAWLPQVALLLLGLLAYAPSFQVFFLADDYTFIHVAHQMGLGQLLSHAGEGGFLRPLVLTAYWVDYRLWGLNPAGYHFTNVFFHSLSGVWIYVITLLLTDSIPAFTPARRRGMAMLAALIFLLLPSHPEAVTWIAGRSDVLATFFYLASLGSYLRFRRDGGGGWIALSLAALALGLMAKEPAITLPAVVALNEGRLWLGGDPARRPSLRSSAGLLAAYFAVIPAYFGVRFTIMSTFTGGYGAVHMDYPLSRLLSNTLTYLTMSVMPRLPQEIYTWLVAVWEGVRARLGAPILADLLLLLVVSVGAAGLVWATVGRRPQPERRSFFLLLLFAGAAYAVTLAPVINLAVTFATGEGSRYAYLPSVFTALLTALFVGILWPRRRGFLLASGVLLTMYGASLFMVNSQWRSAGDIARTLLDGARPVAQADHLYVTNLPDTYRGIFVFRSGYALALDLFDIREYAKPTQILTYHTMMTPQDGLAVSRTDASGVFTARLENPATGFLNTQGPVDSTFFADAYQVDAFDGQGFTLFVHRFQPTDALLTFSGGAVRTDVAGLLSIQPDQMQPYFDRPLGEIYGDQVVSQSFVAINDGLMAVDLLLATFDRINTGTLEITLADDTGTTVATWNLPASEIVNNAWKRLVFSPLIDSADRVYNLNVRHPGGTANNALTLWMSGNPGAYPPGLLMFGGNPTAGALAFRTYVMIPEK